MKWFKRAVWLLAATSLVGVLVGAVGWYMVRRAPDWYQPDTSSDEERRTAAGKVESGLARLYNHFSGLNAAEINRKRLEDKVTANQQNAKQAALVQSEKPDSSFPLEFTDVQLTAFFNKWSNWQNRREMLDQYIEAPRLVVRENEIILVGKVKSTGLIVSVCFTPKLTEQGELDLQLTRVLAGVLPLPDAAWSGQRAKMERMLRQKLPQYQQEAAVDENGVANSAMASAAMNKMLLGVLHNRPSRAVIFVPLKITDLTISMPVKITSVTLHDHTIEMTAEQMSPAERTRLLQDLKTPERPGPTPDAPRPPANQD